MRPVTCGTMLFSDGDSESGYASGPLEFPAASSWQSVGGVQEGGIDSGSGTTLRIPVGEDDHRRLFAIEVSGMTIKRNLDPDFGWAGGTPPSPIDLEALNDMPVSADIAYAVKVSNLWVMTDRLLTNKMVVASPASGRWYYVEGELLADFQAWDPPLS